jgi:ABC-type uncharacterized transport system fused permease/ATPase subunit
MTLISVAHRKSLVKFHRWVLQYESGVWHFERLKSEEEEIVEVVKNENEDLGE